MYNLFLYSSSSGDTVCTTCCYTVHHQETLYVQLVGYTVPPDYEQISVPNMQRLLTIIN
jgi:hypothetical protein